MNELIINALVAKSNIQSISEPVLFPTAPIKKDPTPTTSAIELLPFAIFFTEFFFRW